MQNIFKPSLKTLTKIIYFTATKDLFRRIYF